MKNTFNNPILSGFYPDPSVCRVGEDYYMATSSFVYYPGIPIFHSRDLVHWEQLGHAIHRPEQLDYKNIETSLGLWAPTLRYHNETFYVINTFVSEGREARRDNYILTAKDPAGPWSDPVMIQGADGIDPTLFFDDDGSMWYAGNYICPEPEYEGHHGIYLQELDPETFQLKGQRYDIWNGRKTRSKWIEAPHIYKRNGFYYLLVAEGGTFTNHSIMMARCETIHGDYEICPRNPILSHRHMPLMSEISVVGHGDIVETQNGEWWMVVLGIRPYEGFHFNLGRETFLVPVCWDENDGWLRVQNANGVVNSVEKRPDLPESIYPLPRPTDHFDDDTLSLMWNTIHPAGAETYSLSPRKGFLRLLLKPEVLHEVCTPAFVGRRQQHKVFQATAAMEFTPATAYEEAGIALVQDDRFHYTFVVCADIQHRYLCLYQTENGSRTLLHKEILENAERIYLTVRGEETAYRFYYSYKEHSFSKFYEPVTASLLSSNTNEGFTGVYLGMYASANHRPSDSYADFDWFDYFPG